MFLEINNLSFAIDNQIILNNISFSLEKNQRGCLLGPSGCGKSTLLRCIAGLENPSLGEIYQNGILVNSHNYVTPPHTRSIGMVPQDLALFPHLTVTEHITFSIKNQSETLQKAKVQELLEMTGLGPKKDCFPYQLSGGQQKRVALARALSHDPELLILDEPFSNIDFELREQLLKEMALILDRKKVSVLLVTHDQHEAFIFTEYCGIIRKGELLQWDTCYRLYHQPSSEFVASFLGEGSFVTINKVIGQQIFIGQETITITTSQIIPNNIKKLFLRPDDICYSPDGEYNLPIIKKEFRGPYFAYSLLLPNGEILLCHTRSHINLSIHDQFRFTFDLQHCIFF
ncbi:MAG: ABC transporter ATP-binding protein [Methylacidiphilales bacterium]|nr:ABC transporter ATP-binding protein [Candidatus Methylacidiphilales bacterium]